MCDPAEPSNCVPRDAPVSAAVASLHGPVALMITRARTGHECPVSRSSATTPVNRALPSGA